LIEEKSSLECTLVSLSEEVEFLSQKNEQFLSDLKNKNFYGEYQSVQEELNQLRKSHLSLIDLIEGKEIAIDKSVYPMTNSLLKKWKRENLLNASIGRGHSNSMGTLSFNNHLLTPHHNLASRKNKPGVKERAIISNNQNVTSDRIFEYDQYHGNGAFNHQVEMDNDTSLLSRLFNWRGFDNTENNHELSIQQDV